MKSLRFLLLLIIALPLLFGCDDLVDPETVANPVINPNGGTFTNAINVTIDCATDDAVIKYTTDGTEPDSSATAVVYTTPINVTTDTVIKAVATKTDWNASAIVTASFHIYDQMVEVAAGNFNMGRTNGTGDADNDDLPVHAVNLTRDFYIGKYEVTQAEWTAIMGSNPSNFVGNNLPVEMVSFYSVLAYCNKRSIAEGLTPAYTIKGSTNPTVWGDIPTVNDADWNAAVCNLDANGYRLPTEAEWEYAARGGVNTPDYQYSGSNTVGDVAWFVDNANATSHVVGGKTANGLGIYDMSGNVQEWVWDWYLIDYYSTSPYSDPTGPATAGPTNHRVIRGGSWEQTALFSQVSYRNRGSSEKGMDKVSNSRLGFRVVRTAQ
ncbi:MAG TPA: SUMF1/EgtB/PvdO family nonheme iron enzyme [Candidatus Syntrophosphaera sp.]|nr:SUMF1/EgtB/PvdO family nonheme iron enzyme [Candidatus Syntrophosphaera sp.]